MKRVNDRAVTLTPYETQAFAAYHLALEEGLSVEQAKNRAQARFRHQSPEFWAWLTRDKT